MTVNTNGVQPDLEPRFTLRAQDALTPQTIAQYIRLCNSLGLAEQEAEAVKALNEITMWQSVHPERVKLPDHAHVPTSQA